MNSLFHAMFLWLSAIVVSFKNSLIFTQDVTDASMNTCCKLKLVFLKKMGILYQTETMAVVYTKRTQEKRRLGTIIQSIFCAQSRAGMRLNFWKQFCESWNPGALSPVLENFRRALSPDLTDCPWVSEDDQCCAIMYMYICTGGVFSPGIWYNNSNLFFVKYSEFSACIINVIHVVP